jgi:hypothetical protein
MARKRRYRFRHTERARDLAGVHGEVRGQLGWPFKKHAMSKIATPAARDTAHIARRIAQRKMRGFAGPIKAACDANCGCCWREGVNGTMEAARSSACHARRSFGAASVSYNRLFGEGANRLTSCKAARAPSAYWHAPRNSSRPVASFPRLTLSFTYPKTFAIPRISGDSNVSGRISWAKHCGSSAVRAKLS